MQKMILLSLLCPGLVFSQIGSAAPKSAQTTKPLPKLAPLFPVGGISKQQWEETRKELRLEWTKVLGEFLKDKAPLLTQVLATEQLPEFKREHIRYQIEPGLYTDGYLLTPKGAVGKLPGIVVFHGTSGFGARSASGVEPTYPEEKRQGVQFARCGYVVWCPRNYINTDGADYAGNAKKILDQHPTWTGMTRMTWDAIRAADFMETLSNVDKKRIACFGHSLGGKEVLYAMAFDERYCAGVSSEGGIGLPFSNWDAVWYLGPQIRSPDFRREHHELLALVAPRPFLLIAGDFADDQRSELYLDAVRPLYQLYGASKDLQFFNHHKGHPYGPHAQSVAEVFIAKYLLKPARR